MTCVHSGGTGGRTQRGDERSERRDQRTDSVQPPRCNINTDAALHCAPGWENAASADRDVAFRLTADKPSARQVSTLMMDVVFR